MFHHKEKNSPVEEKKVEINPQAPAPITAAPKEFTLNQVGELLEKNLKWSQIIYEQNRKINRKLLWSSIVSWFYFIIIIAPIILALFYLPPLIRNVYGQYQSLLGGGLGGIQNQAINSSVDQVLQLLPLDNSKQEQLKALLK